MHQLLQLCHVPPRLMILQNLDHINHVPLLFFPSRLPSPRLLQVWYFHPLQGYDPKLDQVLHSQLVACRLWCNHRMACADRGVLFIDQSNENWSGALCWLGAVRVTVKVGREVQELCMFLYLYMIALYESVADIEYANYFNFLEEKCLHS